MLRKFVLYPTLLALILCALVACQSSPAPETDPTGDQSPSAQNGVSLSAEDAYTNFDKTDEEAGTAVAISLADNNTTVTGAGVNVKENTITITATGTYRLSGTLTNGQVCVNVAKTDKVRLILDGVSLWGICIPLGFITAFILKLPVWAVYLCLTCDEMLKLPFSHRRYKSGKWLKNITRDV